MSAKQSHIMLREPEGRVWCYHVCGDDPGYCTMIAREYEKDGEAKWLGTVVTEPMTMRFGESCEVLKDAPTAIDDETPCLWRNDGMHCNHRWYDGERCCACAKNALELTVRLQAQYELTRTNGG